MYKIAQTFTPHAADERHLTGIEDTMLRYIQRIQLMDTALWERFVHQFDIGYYYDSEDDGWRGEYWGKMMRGACITYGYTRDEKLYAVLENTVRELLRRQDSLGRIASYAPDRELSGWDVWCRKYVLLGLLHFTEICRDETLKEDMERAMCAQLDYLIEKTGPHGTVPLNETSDFWCGANSVSLLEPVVRLYVQTGEPRYLDFARHIVETGTREENLFAIDATARAPYTWPVTKAYEMMSCFEGLLEYYRVTGNESYKDAAVAFADAVMATDVTIIGCCGCEHELFDNSARTQTDTTYEGIMQETCVTVTWIKFCYRLLCITGEPRFADAIEQAVYNALYGAINTEGVTVNDGLPFDSYSPLRLHKRGRATGGRKLSPEGEVVYGCCAAIGAAGTGLVPQMAAQHTPDGLVFQLYIGGEYAFDNGWRIRVDTAYPTAGQVTLTVVEAPAEEQTLRLRVPAFATGSTVAVAGQAQSVTAGAYATICRQWAAGEALRLDIAMHPRTVRPLGVAHDPASRNFIAVLYGPLVLARDRRHSVDVGQPVALDVAADGSICLQPAPLPDFPALCAFRAPCQDGSAITLVDYQSAGKTWEEDSLTEAWLPTTL